MNSTLPTNNIIIRPAVETDIPVILEMIKGLAEFEKLLDNVKASEENLMQYIFGADKFVSVWIAECDNIVAGHLIYFRNFSTFLANPGLYIEELYVKPEFRGKGIGKRLLQKAIEISKGKNYGRVEWAVLDWNEGAIEFYKSMRATPMDDWKIFRISKDKFDDLIA